MRSITNMAKGGPLPCSLSESNCHTPFSWGKRRNALDRQLRSSDAMWLDIGDKIEGLAEQIAGLGQDNLDCRLLMLQKRKLMDWQQSIGIEMSRIRRAMAACESEIEFLRGRS